MAKEVEEIMSRLKATASHREAVSPPGKMMAAINWAGLLALVEQYGPALISFILTLIPAGTPAGKVANIVQATIDAMHANGILPDPASPAA